MVGGGVVAVVLASAHAFVINRWIAAAIALGAIAVVLVIAHVLIVHVKPPDSTNPVAVRRRGVKALVIGTDGRASTSKVQAVLWTFAVLFAFMFLLVWGRSASCGEADVKGGPRCTAAATARASFDKVVNNPLQSEYYVLLGFPIAAAVAAKALTTNKVATGQLTKPPIGAAGATPPKGVAAGVSEVIGNDAGETDLLDFQYFAFTLVTLTFFFVEFLTHPGKGLPDLPPTLIGLSGFSVAAYTTKQALVTNVKSVITTVIPHRVKETAGTTVKIIGSGFGARPAAPAAPPSGGAAPPPPVPPWKGKVLLDGAELDVAAAAWTDTEITASITAATLTGLDPAGSASAPITVIDSDGVQSDPFNVELTP